MIKVIAIYDNSGVIWTTNSQIENLPNGLQNLIVEIPSGYELVSIDTSQYPHVPVLKKGENKIEELEMQVTDIQLALTEIYEGMV